MIPLADSQTVFGGRAWATLEVTRDRRHGLNEYCVAERFRERLLQMWEQHRKQAQPSISAAGPVSAVLSTP